MEEDQSSKTAEAAAATRAYYHAYRPPAIFEDPYAKQFLTGFWRLVLATPLRHLVFEHGMKKLQAVGGQVVARSRFAEDRLNEAVVAGLEQYVIIGAGYDTFSLRRPAAHAHLRVFELDHPATQAEKLTRLRKVTGSELPVNVEFVPINFETQTLADALAESSFTPNEPAFFSWLGTTPYLDNETTMQSLRDIADCAHCGSELVFDYLVNEEGSMDATQQEIYRVLKDFTARRGEPIIGELPTKSVESLLDAIGVVILEQLDHKDQMKLYFSAREDGLQAMPGSYLIHGKVLEKAD